jgi:hypothetical protein
MTKTHTFVRLLISFRNLLVERRTASSLLIYQGNLPVERRTASSWSY